MKVTLTPSEVVMAATIGAMRQAESMKSNLKPANGFKDYESPLSIHVEGACGEAAYCKARNQFFEGRINTFKEADIGKVVQIRTRSKEEYDLIVRENDSDAEYFVLLTGVCPTYTIHGYILGADAKQEKWKKNYGGRTPAYFVPKEALKPMRFSK